MRHFLCIVFFVVLNCTGARAQYNSDCKTVARKHIKTASAYSVQGDGDTSFNQYCYDKRGRLISIESFCWNEWHTFNTYDINGNLTGNLELEAHVNMDTVQSEQQVKRTRATITYDTVYQETNRYNLSTNQLEFWSQSLYEEGKLRSIYVNVISLDTSIAYYLLPDGSIVPEGITIKSSLDSIKFGYAETHYTIEDNDTTFSSFSIHVSDRHGNTVRLDGLGREYYGDFPMTKPDGSTYHPLEDTTLKTIVYYTYINEYNVFGRLSKVTQISHVEKEDNKVTDLARNRVFKFDSSWHITHLGVVTYEYYE
jgi:hypothetical protein